MFALEVELSTGDPPNSASSQTEIGYQLWSSDRTRVVQARQNGFSISHLKPYSQWSKLRADAEKLWPLFAAGADLHVTRCAVRFINRIGLPLEGLELGHYLKLFPAISPELPQTPLGLFMRIAWQVEGAEAVVTEAFDKADLATNTLPFILDIDASQACSCARDSDILWKDLDKLRDIKNDIFFGCLTEKAKDLLQ
jgi:uncharacterized protein (TIGR04255 family)